MAHFHGPATEGKNGPPVIWLKEKGAAVESPIKGEATLSPEQAQQLMAAHLTLNRSSPGLNLSLPRERK